MEELKGFFKGVAIYGTILLILQFCINGVFEIFGHPEITFLQTICVFILFVITIFFASYFWSRGKTGESKK